MKLWMGETEGETFFYLFLCTQKEKKISFLFKNPPAFGCQKNPSEISKKKFLLIRV